MDPAITAAIVTLVGGAAVAAATWIFKTWRGRRDAAGLDAAGASRGEWRAAARDVRAELRDIRAEIAAAQQDPTLTSEDTFPVEAFARNRQTLMKAASTDQGNAVEEAYRRVRLLRRHVAAGNALPIAELQGANDAVNAAVSQLDHLETALKTRAKAAGRPRVGSAAVTPRRDKRRH